MSNAQRRAESANRARVTALEAENRLLRAERDRQLPFGWAELVRWIPELDRLHRVLLEAVWLADPRKARTLQAVGGGGSQAALPAPDTAWHRDKLRRTRHAIAGAVADLDYELADAYGMLSPDDRRPAGEGPRCGCRGSGRRRQLPGQPRCGWCGRDLRSL